MSSYDSLMAQPGWYPDPSGAPGKRYWNGTQWIARPVASGKTSKAWVWILVATVLAFGGCATLMSMAPKHTGDGPAATVPTTATVGINEPVRDGKFEFVVTNAANRGGYFTVTMTARNIGDEAQTFFAGNQKLIDGSGRTYDSDSMGVYDFNQSAMIDLNPGMSTGTIVVPFKVGPGQHLAFVEVHDSAFSGGAKVSLAGAG